MTEYSLLLPESPDSSIMMDELSLFDLDDWEELECYIIDEAYGG